MKVTVTLECAHYRLHVDAHVHKFLCMERHVRLWQIAVAAASTTLLLALPALAAAAHLNNNEPLGTTFFNRVIQRLCEIQQALGNRVILADPARCAPPPPPPPPPTATLTLVKMVVNDNGGTATSSDFTIYLHQAPSMVDVPSSPQLGSATGTTYTNLSAGNYHIAETVGPLGYAASLSGDCDANGNIILAAGESKMCTITNDDQQGMLIVKKVVIRDNGNNAATTTFSFQVNDGTPMFFDEDGQVEIPLNAGTYTVNEGAHDGFTTTTDNCDNVVLSNGGTVTCTITNNDNPSGGNGGGGGGGGGEGKLLITEVLYDLASTTTQGEEPENEWVEIYNGTSAVMNLGGFTLNDAVSTSTVPDGTVLPSGAYLVVTGSTTTASLWTIPGGTVVVVLDDGTIGSGLNNTGDRVFLRGPTGIEVDVVSWGSDTSAFAPSVSAVPDGNSITRTSPTTDTNAAADWVADPTPTPGS